jgi:hypothetical protein
MQKRGLRGPDTTLNERYLARGPEGLLGMGGLCSRLAYCKRKCLRANGGDSVEQRNCSKLAQELVPGSRSSVRASF